jgi:hypothetical protein
LEVTSCGSKQGNDILDSLVGLVIRGLQFAVWTVRRIGLVVKAAVGQGATQSFVKKKEEQGHLDALCGELIGITAAIAFQQVMAFQFAQIVAKLVQTIAFGGKLKRGQYGFVDLLGSPAADSIAAVKQNLQ